MFFIVGTGHCGTKWLSSVLDSPENRVKCVHEYRNTFYNIDWISGIRKQELEGLQGFREYFENFIALKKDGWKTGDSNSFPLSVLIEENNLDFLKNKVGVSHIHLLVRNGIRTINSIIVHNLQNNPLDFLRVTAHTNAVEQQISLITRTCTDLNLERENFLSDTNLKSVRDSVERLRHVVHHGLQMTHEETNEIVQVLSPLKKLSKIIAWGQGTYNLKNINKAHKAWGDNLFVWRLEDLTQDKTSIENILNLHDIKYSDDKIRKMQKNDVNKKIKTKDIHTMLQGWGTQELKWFKIFCEDTMKYHNYDMEVFNNVLKEKNIS